MGSASKIYRDRDPELATNVGPLSVASLYEDALVLDARIDPQAIVIRNRAARRAAKSRINRHVRFMRKHKAA